MNTEDKEDWLERYGYITWHNYADPKREGGQWNSYGRGGKSFSLSIKASGRDNIINILFDAVKDYLFNTSNITEVSE